MKLIIVESPTKARTLGRFLGGAYRVEASLGHVRDLPKSQLGVDPEHDFAVKYVIPRDKTKRVKELRELAAKADSVVLATDPDREGEAIAWHIQFLLTDPKSKLAIPASKISRISFHEITETAIQEALNHPGQIDAHLVDAQQARRVLDRLVGYKLSPLLWQKLSRRWLSAGRVQSVAVRLIVEREREIKKFQTQEFWTIDAMFGGAEIADGLTARLVAKSGVKYEQTLTFNLFDGTYTTTTSTIANEQAAGAIVSDFSAPFRVTAADKREVRRSPAAPYTTSTLQQEAGRRLYFSAKRTMQVAQKLYEEGLITYHRTDSMNLAEKFATEARQHIMERYGKEFIPVSPRLYHTKSKVAQEAHEAIRPTDVHRDTLHDVLAGAEMNRDHERLYELIWKRAVASQMADAVFDSTTVDIASRNEYVFEVQGSVIKFEGYLAVWGRENGEAILPTVAVGDMLTLKTSLPLQHWTSPPPRYTEASLVKTLEEKDIGRPSTYAPIISTIQERQYVTRQDKKLVSTELGDTVADFLVQYFPEILDLPFTASMEGNLDEIAAGRNWVPVIAEFYGPFSKQLEETYNQASKVKVEVETLAEKCPKCGNPLVVRTGRYGKFISCSTFPTCDYKRALVEKIDMKCPRCGGDIVIKKTRRGKMFYGCSNYPNCTFAAWKKEDIK